MMRTNLDSGVRIVAVFEPRNKDDLKLGAEAMIGCEGEFEALWKIADGYDYAGEWAMRIPDDWQVDGFWVPSGDLKP